MSTRGRDLETFGETLPAATYVLMDEAYHPYVGESADYASFIDHPVDNPRLIVTRSFSNACGLAGARVGYGVAAPETARLLALAGLPEDVNVVAAAGAMAALDHSDHGPLKVPPDR